MTEIEKGLLVMFVKKHGLEVVLREMLDSLSAFGEIEVSGEQPEAPVRKKDMAFKWNKKEGLSRKNKRGARLKLTPSRIDRIQRMLKGGMSRHEVAQTLKLSVSSVRKATGTRKEWAA